MTASVLYVAVGEKIVRFAVDAKACEIEELDTVATPAGVRQDAR